MTTVQYEPIKKVFRIVSNNIVAWRNLTWLKGCFAFRGFPYNWQVVMDNPGQVYYL